MKQRNLLTLLIFILLVSFALTSGKKRSTTLVPAAQCATEGCITWCQNCRDAARNQYDSCIASNIPSSTCDAWRMQFLLDCYSGLPCTCGGASGGCYDGRTGLKVPCP